jgi:hypothetical protein
LSAIAKRYIITILILTLSLNGSIAQFGSKVASGDVDVGRLLYNFPAGQPSLKYWDISSNGYTGDDIVYLAINPASTIVNAYDVRLKPFNSYPAGSKVESGNNDIGMPLTVLAGNSGIYFLDLYGDAPGYSREDPVYILPNPPLNIKTIINDIRLTQVGGLLAPGTRVLDFHPDHDKVATPLISPVTPVPSGPLAAIRFFNRNGNIDPLGFPVYDSEDDVYLDISLNYLTTFGFVVPNNLRLSR